MQRRSVNGVAARLRQANRDSRRQRLIDEDLRRHGPLGIRAVLAALEIDYGIEDLNLHLKRLLEADPGALALLDGPAR